MTDASTASRTTRSERRAAEKRPLRERIKVWQEENTAGLWIAGIIIAILAVIVVVFMVNTMNELNSSKKSAAAAATSEATTSTVDADGTIRVLPIVGSESETAPVDTTQDPRTPATFAPFTKSGQVVLTWSELVSAVNGADATWYIDAVNDRAKATGFAWEDVEKWANDPQLDGISPLTIQVFGDFSDEKAREIASELVGHDMAALLPIERRETGRLINTRSAGNDKVSDFLDMRRMVRVSLSPITYGKDGEVVGVLGNSGVFADCLNIWRLAMPVKSSSTTPPPTTTPITPPTTPPPTTTPITPPTTPPPTTPPPPSGKLTPKVPSEDPAPQGNAPEGGGRNEDPGPGTYIPPEEMEQPPAAPRVNPDPPAPEEPPVGSTPDPTPPPAPEPVPVPSPPDDPAEGESPIPGK